MRRVYRGFRDRSLSVWVAWALGGGKLPDRTKLKQRKFARPENPPDDGGCAHSTSPRRALIFVLLGPILSVFAIFAVLPTLIGPIDLYGLPFVLLFSLVVCAITAPVDGALALFVPGWSRVPLTAVAGAAVAAGVAFAFFLYLSIHLGKPMVAPMLYQLIPIALFGALNAGVCSLLTHCFRRD